MISLISAAGAATSTYTITDLGVDPASSGGGPNPYSVNNKGQVAGAIIVNGAIHPALWLPSPDYGLPAGWNDLGTLSPGGQGYAWDINDAGQVVGRSGGGDFFDTGNGRAFIWDSVNGMRDLGSLPGYAYATAQGLNNIGQAAGYSYNYSGDPYYHAVLWSGGVITYLGTLGGTYSNASEVNDSAVVTGTSQTGGGQDHGFVWTALQGMQDIGTLGGSSSGAGSINAIGQVVGQSQIAGDTAWHAFLFGGALMQDLGTLGGTNSYGNDINALGQVAGESQITGDTTFHAFIYSNGATSDLNTLIPSGSGWELRRAIDLNDLGQIVGFGIINGQAHGFLLTPVNTPPTCVAAPPVGAIQWSGNGHYYALTAPNQHWNGANAEATNRGGYLVSILSQAEQDFLYSTFGSQPYLWIGFTDTAVEGTFAWTSGEPTGYTNWYPGEPNNDQGIEDWGIMVNTAGRDGRWHDGTEFSGFNGVGFPGIIEFETCTTLPMEHSAVYVADTGNHRIQRSVDDGATWAAVGLGPGTGLGQFRAPTGVEPNSTNTIIFVADTGNNRLQRSTNGGLSWQVIAGPGTAIGQVSAPSGLAYDEVNDKLYVADTGNSRLQVATNAGSSPSPTFAIFAGATAGTSVGHFRFPTGVAVDAAGLVYVSDTGNHRIQKNTTGTSSGWGIFAGTTRGAAVGQMNSPTGIFVDSTGRVYVADTGNNRIQINTGGTATGWSVFMTAGTAAGFVRYPGGVVLAASQNVFVGDTGNSRVQKKPVGGGPAIVVGGPGTAIGQFRFPTGVR
jgi:probable HAF family extracellular repeat protein